MSLLYRLGDTHTQSQMEKGSASNSDLPSFELQHCKATVEKLSLLMSACRSMGEVKLHAQTDGSMSTVHRQSFINCVLAEDLAPKMQFFKIILECVKR